jgi:hypothetical protein
MDVGSLLMGGGGAGVIAAVIQTIVQRRKLGADTASVLTKAASNLVQPLSDQIDRLERKVLALEARVESLTVELDDAHDLNRHKDDLLAALTREHAARQGERP